ncbi:MAG: DNA polymerase III subunit gamma/tau, partial [Thermoguttaceae bacterium]|nr:DNA polymerase III subunit gamma/tau [Thermoguttaceae bacterium]
QVVARRYRPMEFDQLVGQSHIAKALSNAILTNRVGHAYLFTGARGVGKTSSARIFAKALCCVHGPTPTPCNECEICRGISSGEDIDVLEIDGASNRGIDQIQYLRQNVSVRPSRARYKIYIIDEVHMLTKEAFNALLKTLEEPPKHVKFIFCTTEPTKIPITILSRCQRFDFAGIDSVAISKRLEQIAAQEGATLESGVCDLLARRANGSMRDAQSLLEQLLSFASQNVSVSDVHDALGTVDDRKLLDLVAGIARGDAGIVLTLLQEAGDRGADFSVLIEQMMGIFRDMMVAASDCPAKSMLYASFASFDEVKKLALSMGINRILASLQVLDQTYQRLRYSTQGRILSELAFVRLCYLDRFTRITQVIDMLRSGNITVEVPAAGRSSKIANSPTANDTDQKKKCEQLTQAAPVAQANQTTQAISTTPTASDWPAVNNPPSQAVGVSVPPDIDYSSDMESDIPPDVYEASSALSRQESAPPEETAAPAAQFHLANMNDALALKVWKDILGTLSAQALVAQGRACDEVHFQAPNVIMLVFPADFRFARDFCRDAREKLTTAFAPFFDGPIELAFELSQKRKNPLRGTPGNSPRSQGELLHETDAHPMIQQLKSLFGAELTEVKLPEDC